jgi:hypothetical protein
MAGERSCRQCSTVFMPRREHAQFCSRTCRVAWNREQLGGVPVGPSVLEWSIAAMREATGRLNRIRAWDRTRAFEAINDAVWRVTMLDAALVRYYAGVYDDTLDRFSPADQVLTEETLAGLRLVRNRVREPDDLARFVDSGTTAWGPQTGEITSRRWKAVSARPSGARSKSASAWEQSRYRAYQSRLAGTAIGDTFERCSAFLLATASGVTATTHPDAPTTG